MRNIISILLCLSIVLLSGCTNASKISKLEKEIKEIDSKIELKENELKDWQEVYDEAKDIYYAPHSNNSAVQKELERTKEMMDDANKEVNAIKREIDLLKMDRDFKEKDLEELK